MKIAVIGAGIIGVTTAFELACDGHEVTVMERRSAAAEEASFATTGIVAPGCVTPWPTPGMPLGLLKQFFNRHAAVRLELPLSAAAASWMWQWNRACKPQTHAANQSHMHALASYSQARLHHITAELKLEYDRSDGQLVLLRTEKDSQLIQPSLHLLRDAGGVFKQLSAAEIQKIEPALNPDTALFGAVHLPNDEVGNCRQFALLLKNEAQRRGVRFCFNTTVAQIAPGARVLIGLAGESEAHDFDAAVVCAGLDSVGLLAALGPRIPMMAVHGYSISASVREPLNAPRSAVLDEHYKVAISRLGNRVRVAGMAELGGVPGKKRQDSLQTLYKVLNDWFPGAANLSSGVQEWKGARPMLPHGPPLLGASGHPGVWLNLGHGASGWTLACGSARVLADQLGGRAAELDTSAFNITRLKS